MDDSTKLQPDQPYISLDELIARIRKYHPDEDMSLVERAYHFAEDAHKGQFRKSGDPYFSHPCAVAVILADLMLDATTIAAGLLHDCIEDVDGVTCDLITQQFGQEVELLVDGVTKLTRLNFSSREAQQAESLRKMFLAMAKDIRVVLIKLADRLHNMRTLRSQRPERQVPIAQETLDIYAPLAHRLGVYTIKWELEDLALRYIDPDGYYDLVQKVGMRRAEREEWIKQITSILSEKLKEAGIEAEIEGRPKHFYSIYHKMKSQNKTFDQINDLIALRVLVDTTQDCYYALGIVHNLWRQVPGRFKDYISVPKANMYQSLHTTVVGTEGRPFEVQIRTYDMHSTAEYGIAAHWRYKEGKQADELDKKLSWLRRILDWQKEALDPKEFGEMLKFDLFSDEVFVFTPKGDVISLPIGATPLDYAYRIHTAIGNKCIGAKVNGRIVPLGSALETGDFVEIMTSSASHGPSRDWLKIVKTSDAKAKIRGWLKKENKDENLIKGKEMMERESKRMGYALSQLTKPEFLEPVYHRYTLNNLDDLFVTVGFGGLTTNQVLNRLIEEYKKAVKPEQLIPTEPKVTLTATEAIQQREETQRKQASSSSNGVIVKGEAGMLVHFARCCNPLPGDDIIGYITKGRGVSVHRSDCVNMKEGAVEQERLIEVQWEGKVTSTYEADIQIIAYDRSGLVAEISMLLISMEVPMLAITARASKQQRTSTISLTLSIKSTQQLEKVIKQLLKRPDVLEVYRVIQ